MEASLDENDKEMGPVALAILILLPSAYLLYTYQSIKSTAVRIYEEQEPSPVVQHSYMIGRLFSSERKHEGR